MKPAPPETAELLHRVRQQLILAQVRLMELEDVRDELAPKLTDTEKLLAAAQTLTDQKVEEAGHLTKTLSNLQAQYDHLRHMQHVTNEALNETRRELAETTSQLTAAQKQNGQLEKEIRTLTDQAGELSANLKKTSRELDEENAIAMERLIRANKLDGDLRALKTSRSWRWTAWLRAIERTLGGGKS